MDLDIKKENAGNVQSNDWNYCIPSAIDYK